MRKEKRYGVFFIVQEEGLVATNESANNLIANVIRGFELDEAWTYKGLMLNNPKILARAFETEIKKRDESTKVVKIVLLYISKDNYCYNMCDEHLNPLIWHLREYDEDYLSGQAIREYTIKNNTFEHYIFYHI